MMSAIRLVLGCRSNQWKECRLGPRSMRIAAEQRAVDLSSSHQFEEEIGASSSENRLIIPKMEFSVRTGVETDRYSCERDAKIVLTYFSTSSLRSVLREIRYFGRCRTAYLV